MTGLLCTTFGYDTIKFIKIGVEIEYIDRDPLHDIDILWEHYDRFEIPFYEGSFYERTA